MKQQLKQLMLTALVALCCITASAYSFKAGGLYYNITSSIENTVEVTGGDFNNSYSGDVIIPSTVTYLGKNFSVTAIVDAAFYGCNSLTSVAIPNSVTKIGGGAFYDCSNLASVVLPNSVTEIGDYAFGYCTSLLSVVLGNSITKIGDYAFLACSSLEEIKSLGVTPPSICSNGFMDLTKKQSILEVPSEALEAYMASNGWHDFANVEAYVEEPECDFDNFCVDGIYYNVISKDTKIVEVTSGDDYSSYSGDVTIPSRVTYSGINFWVTKIGNFAFAGSSCLTLVVIPNSIKEIGAYAFSGCTSLSEIILQKLTPPALKSSSTFANVSKTECVIKTPVGAADAYKSTLYWQDFVNIRPIVEEPEIEFNNFCVNGIYYNVISKYALTVEVTSGDNYNSYSGDLTIPSTVTYSGIDFSVTKIGYGAFRNSTNLTSVKIPDSVTDISDEVFRGCTGLSSIIGKFSSEDKRCLIFDGVLKAFAPAGLTAYSIPNTVKKIGWYAFAGCTNLTSIEIPNSVTWIGWSAFYDCTGLTLVEFPNSVTVIGSSSFAGCTNLASIMLPNSVTKIDGSAFSGCSKLKEIISLNTTPPEIKSSTFSNVPKTGCSIKIPGEALGTYMETVGWKDFKHFGVFDYNLIDGEAYTETVEIVATNVNYIRTFSSYHWVPLYISFSMDYAEWAEWADVAEINDVHQFFGDDPYTVIEFRTLDGGRTRPNTPYVIRVKKDAVTLDEPFTKNFEDKTLCPASNGIVDCCSAHWQYKLTGVYEKYNQMKGKYALNANTGQFTKGTSNKNTLLPQRFYLEISARDGGYGYEVEGMSANVRVLLAVDDEFTGIESVIGANDDPTSPVYNLQGVRVGDNYKGIVIVNGKKILR